jgi:hypothetical protein
MSEGKGNISSDSVKSEFVVPQNFFREHQCRIQNCLDHDDFIRVPGLLDRNIPADDSSEFAVPEGYFRSSANQLHRVIKKGRSRLLVVKIATAVAAVWCAGILIWYQTRRDPVTFDELIATTEIEPQDLLLHSNEEEIYWAYVSLCDTLVDDTTSVISAPERLDPKTGLPMSKAKQLEGIDWNDISADDLLEYLKETNTDDEYYN